jgi:predicted transcriptional regulator
MAKAKRFDLAPVLDDEDDETLAAIDEGIRAADAGQVIPAEKSATFCPSELGLRP